MQRRRAALALIEALGAVLVVVGLIFWSLPAGLIMAGGFMIYAANAPDPGPVAHPSSRAGSGSRRAA